jgi:hypothetical protein
MGIVDLVAAGGLEELGAVDVDGDLVAGRGVGQTCSTLTIF